MMEIILIIVGFLMGLDILIAKAEDKEWVIALVLAIAIFSAVGAKLFAIILFAVFLFWEAKRLREAYDYLQI